MSKYNTGDKFIIQLGEEVEDGEYAIQGLQGLAVGDSVLDGFERCQDMTASKLFNDGVDFAQGVYRKLHSLNAFEIRDIFGVNSGSLWSVINNFSVSKISDMMENYVPNIEVGDRFIVSVEGDEKYTNGKLIAITNVDLAADTYYYICRDGKTGYVKGTQAFVKMIHKKLPKSAEGGAYRSAFEKIFGSEF